jgi:NAD+ diphosphatase
MSLSPFAMAATFRSGPIHTEARAQWWFVFAGHKLLVAGNSNGAPQIVKEHPATLGMATQFIRLLGRLGTIACYVAAVDKGQIPPANMEFRDLRGLYGALDDDAFRLAGRAIQIIHWHHEHLFCGRCATPMEDDDREELARRCPSCSMVSYPRLSPAVIMSVVRDDHILLARGPRFPKGMYSALAGFVEPGETLEEAVAREVMEEVGVRVGKIRYLASQPWPFPHSLMIGFTTVYESGDIVIERGELEDARWFSRKDMPLLPSPISISRLLIDNFLALGEKR